MQKERANNRFELNEWLQEDLQKAEDYQSARTDIDVNAYLQNLSDLDDFLNEKEKLYETYEGTITEWAKAKEEERLKIYSEILGNTASLFKENTIVFKALSSAQALIATYEGVTKAIAKVELFPFNFVLAATVGAAGLANVAKINEVKFAEGTEYVDKENRYPSGVDTIPARLNKGERVLTTEQNKQLGNISNDDLVKMFDRQNQIEYLAGKGNIIEGIKIEQNNEELKKELSEMKNQLIQSNNFLARLVQSGDIETYTDKSGRRVKRIKNVTFKYQ